jgi:hypothetical protein
MSISDKFSSFCNNILIDPDTVGNISYRYGRITKQLNIDYWNTESSTSHSLYVGSYGRGTAIHVSDIDVLFRLPYEDYLRYDNYSGNGQSALLYDVRNSLRKTYSTSHISGDGQVVKINFDDGVSFEIVPCFHNSDGSFTYPDTNGGGSWKVTNPKPEIEAIRVGNEAWNHNLKRLCRMARAWKDKWDVSMGGLLIDTLAYNFLYSWQYNDKSFFYYDFMTRDFFEYLKNLDTDQDYWLAPGSNQRVYRKGTFEYKALRCYNISLEAINFETNEMPYSANEKWRDIYGSKFPN